MRSIIAKIVNSREYSNTQPLVLLEAVYDDLVLLLRFIYKSQKNGSLNEPFFFTNQINYLDEMWHHFILLTRNYHQFCEQEFGEYLHHEASFPNEISEDIRDGHDKTIISQMALLEDQLGVDFVRRVFFIYPELLKREENVL